MLSAENFTQSAKCKDKYFNLFMLSFWWVNIGDILQMH